MFKEKNYTTPHTRPLISQIHETAAISEGKWWEN